MFAKVLKRLAPQEKNVILWKTETGDPVYQRSQKNLTKPTWPAIQFSSDEATAYRLATNEVQFFDGRDFSKGIISRLRVPGVAAVELSSTPGSHIAAFIPESKLKWNHGSTGLLVVVQSDVDKTNQSYYGESKLCYLTTDGKHEGLVPLRKEGPVHDAQWSCSGLEFAVVYGFMPAKATMFDKNCNPLLELGTGPYNTIRWNPKGKLFWDYLDKKQLAATKAEWSVTSKWSPDGRYFMTATTAPSFKLIMDIIKLYTNYSQVDWKPESPSKFVDITELIKSLDLGKVEDKKPSGQGPKTAQASTKASSANPLPQKPAAYRPRHAKTAAAIQAELLGESTGESLSKNALRNKKKREKKAASDASAS
ncbi:hypothetical protein TanjilG_26012 [Lupinus angustifolius]|uniref:Translation initiation factor beta propellor-like domain-containing protein n=1 Tax=Lupinus angustifolius TaxID=3871 RepID=A0A1J7GFT5_LUPAN|nr:hypothetical protein TanjilG_26012 [Lupinus angustifolius]